MLWESAAEEGFVEKEDNSGFIFRISNRNPPKEEDGSDPVFAAVRDPFHCGQSKSAALQKEAFLEKNFFMCLENKQKIFKADKSYLLCNNRQFSARWQDPVPVLRIRTC